MPQAQDTIEIDATPAQCLAVILDYRSYPNFLPMMEKAVVVAEKGETKDVRFTLNLIKRIDYTLRLTPRANGLDWTMVDGPFKQNDGSWTLEALPGGRTKAIYAVEIRMTLFVPRAIEDRLSAQSLPTTLKAFKAEIEKRRK